MAVTYAWRLDANKFAYILSPDGEEGYVSQTPLGNEDLAKVAQRANTEFGEDAELGLESYIKAYNSMITKIKEKWGQTQFYDLLSADIYYNVDASHCADVRGVGIRGIRYLGASDPTTFDFNNPSWNPLIKQNEPARLQGQFSVYGIYMDDQELDTATPESIFVVYNGKDGGTIDGGASTATLEAKLENEIRERTENDNEINALLTNLTDRVNTLDKLNDGDLSGIITDIETLKKNVNELTAKYNEMSSQVSYLSDAISRLEGGDTGVGDVITGNNIKVAEYTNTVGPVKLVGYANDTLYYLTGATHNQDTLLYNATITGKTFFKQ